MKRKVFTLIVAGVLLLFFLGPKPAPIEVKLQLAESAWELSDALRYVDQRAHMEGIRMGNQDSLVWADTVGKKTAFSLVYLHGFSSSRMEGHPLHIGLAKQFGMNLYMPRLAYHGLVSDTAFDHYNNDVYIQSALNAIEVGRALGDQVILMSCSTGGTLSIPIAAENKDKIAALMMYSPNIAIKDPSSQLLSMPWGKQVGEMVIGSEVYHVRSLPPDGAPYWYTHYNIQGLVSLQQMIDAYMQDAYFNKLDLPCFVSYYYKNEEEQDDVVSTEAIDDFITSVHKHADPLVVDKDGDYHTHVITYQKANPDFEDLYSKSASFIENVILAD